MDFKEQVKASVDIVQVVGEHVQLRKVGTRYVGRCPFHSEKTPSFSVHSVHQFYKCFGCGEGGDVFTFVEKTQNVSFYEALKILAERQGMPMPKREGTPDADIQRRAALYRMHEIAAEEFHKLLLSPAGEDARTYLKTRGITREVVVEFGLGFSDRSGSALVRRFEQERIAPEFMESSSLVRKRDNGQGFYDSFRGRLMFPIHSETGKVIGFGGRAIVDGEEAKYINSSESAIYNKSSVLYNLHRAKTAIRQQNRAILVEGYMDVIGVYAAGVHEVVASCGTSITHQHARTLQRLSRQIVLNLDSDAAGARGSDRSIEIFLREGMKIKVLELIGGKDPDEYIKENGVAAYEQALSTARDYFLWLAARTADKYGSREKRDRIQALEELLPTIALVPNEIEKVSIAGELAAFFGVDTSFVAKHFRKSGAALRPPSQPAAVPKVEVRSLERSLVNVLIQSEEFRSDYIPALRTLHVLENFKTKAILEAIFEIHEKDEPVRYGNIEARLTESDRALLASLVLDDQPVEADTLQAFAQSCMQALIAEERKWEDADLRVQIRNAEKAGNLPEAMRLMELLRQRQARS